MIDSYLASVSKANGIRIAISRLFMDWVLRQGEEVTVLGDNTTTQPSRFASALL